jgi:alanine dehydrogenase
MHILTRADVRAAITMPEAIEAAAAGLAAYSGGRAEVPLRIHLHPPGGIALYMPGFLETGGALGAKIVSVFGGNQAVGLPTITAVMILQDAGTGLPLALMEAGYLTALRTGAAAGVATKYLARRDARTVAVYGAGAQSRTQLAAVAAVRDIRRVLIYDPAKEAAAAFAREVADGGFEVEVLADADAGPGLADVIVAATTSMRPVFDGRLVRPGAHINAVGSYTPAMQELDATLLERADILVADARDAALHESGDLIVPVREGRFGPERVNGEVGELVLGQLAGRTSDEQITVYKGVGLAALDLATAQAVYAQALAKGLGRVVELLN